MHTQVTVAEQDAGHACLQAFNPIEKEDYQDVVARWVGALLVVRHNPDSASATAWLVRRQLAAMTVTSLHLLSSQVSEWCTWPVSRSTQRCKDSGPCILYP